MIRLIVLFFVFNGFLSFSQTTYYLTTSGGSYSTEKWVSITTSANGAGTQVWGQGTGTYSNGAGLLTDEAIDLTGYEGQTLYLNCYDKYDDTWDGTVYVLEETTSGPTIINNGGVSPTDGSDDDSSSAWEGTSSSSHANELETSESFTVPSICTEPSTQATSLVYSNVGLNQLDLSWTRGDGDNVLVVAKAGSAATDPDLGTSYSANSIYASGTSVGGGYSVYNGTGTSVTVTGLTAGTTYHFSIYEYNNTDVCYNVTELTSSQATLTYDSDTDVNDPSSQVSATTISSINNDDVSEALEVFKFTIEDQASGDGATTNTTNIRVVPGASNTADWTDNLQGAKLEYDGVSVTVATTTITDTYIDFAISSGNLDITDGESTKEIALLVYLNTSSVSDGDVLQFMVDADNHGWTEAADGSAYAADFGADVSSNNITIEVTATSLAFAQEPTNAVVSNSMSPSVTVEAIDANGNRDVNFSSSIDLTSSGTLTGTTVNTTASSGLATFSTLIHTVVGTSLTLNAERNGTSDWDVTSGTFDISLTPDVCSDALDIYGLTVNLDMSEASNDYDDGETDSGAESSFDAGGWNTIYPCNTASNHSAYYYSDFKDLWLELEIPDGVDEFTITVSNFTGSGYAYFLPYYGTCGSITQMTVGSGGVTSNNMPTLSANGSITFSGAEVITASTSTIFIRVFMHDNSAGTSSPSYISTGCASITYPSFDIMGSAPQINDVDGDAIEIDGTSSSGNLCLAAIESESTETGDACAGSQDDNDLWYKISAGGSDPTAHGKISVTFAGASDAVVVTEYRGAFSNAYNECVTLTSTGAGSTVSYTFLDEINASNTNYYRITPVSGNGVCSFSIAGERVVPNDVCSEFESVSTAYNLSSSRTANFTFASASGTTLPNGSADTGTSDLFYNFTSTSSTIHGTVMYSGKVDITLGSISSGTYTLAVYKRDALYSPCGSLTSNLVSSQTGINSDGTFTLCTDITEGDYLVRLIQTSGSVESITISGTPSAASPLNAEGDYLVSNTSSSQTTFDLISNSFTGEDFDLDNSGCESTSLSDNGGHITDTGKDLWYTFETAATPSCDPTISQIIEGITITLSSSATIGYINLELYSAMNDGAYVDEASISSGNGTATFTGLSPSTRYYLRVEENLNLNNSQFDISAAWTNPIPCYDTGADAYDITGDFSNGPCPRDGSMTVYSMKAANAEMDSNEDVWFKFTQPENADEESFTHIRLNNVSTDFYAMELELYNSASNLPATKIAESPDMTSSAVYDEVFINTGNLTSGATYFIRIVLREAATETEDVTFNLCIFDDNGGHFNIACPATSDDNITLGSAVECDGIAGVDGDCNLTYRLNLTPITPSAWYRIEVIANEEIETPQLYGQGNILGDYDNPCNRSGVGNQVVSSGDISSPSTECTGASYGKWVAINLIGSSSWESNIYNLWVGATAGTGCLGLDLCEINFVGPFASQADAEGGDPSDVSSLYCAFFDYGDLDDGANTYPEVYAIYDDENGDTYPDGGVWLGASIDAENSGLGNSDATGDDTGDGSDDEDGLSILTQGIPGGTGVIRVVGNAVSAGTTVYAGMWVDWDGDGFESDEFYSGSGVSNSPVNIDITVNVPIGFTEGSDAKVLLKAGLSAFAFADASSNVLNGEVEGHIISFESAVLPIELMEFKATSKGAYNMISWITATEKNSEYFVVQRSNNGIDFEELEIVSAAGFSTEFIDYQVADLSPYETTYYRLKNVDFDGQFAYSKIEVVESEQGSKELSFDVYPNPNYGSRLNILVNNSSQEKILLELRDLTGRLMKKEVITVLIGELSQSHILLSDLESGSYFVSMVAEGLISTRKLIIEK